MVEQPSSPVFLVSSLVHSALSCTNGQQVGQDFFFFFLTELLESQVLGFNREFTYANIHHVSKFNYLANLHAVLFCFSFFLILGSSSVFRNSLL